MRFSASAGETGGVRWLIGAFDVPRCDPLCPPDAKRYEEHHERCTNWTKHTRVNKTGQGRRFLIPPARLYRAQIVRVLGTALPECPWLRPGPWHLDFYLATASDLARDFDQFQGGVTDDLIEGGLAKNDAECLGGALIRHPYAPRSLIFVVAREGIRKEQENVDEK